MQFEFETINIEAWKAFQLLQRTGDSLDSYYTFYQMFGEIGSARRGIPKTKFDEIFVEKSEKGRFDVDLTAEVWKSDDRSL